ncbi:MAG: hypothetical protein HC779_01935 [Phyllobacteriaceae bacterium]|nr:hypothetical protein [Phyllobacteriaceae bacterium]
MYAAFTGKPVGAQPQTMIAAIDPIQNLPSAQVLPTPQGTAAQAVATAFAADASSNGALPGLALAEQTIEPFVVPSSRPMVQAFPDSAVSPLRPTLGVPLGYAESRIGAGKADPFEAVLTPSTALKAAAGRLKADAGAQGPLARIHVLTTAIEPDAAWLARIASLGQVEIQTQGAAYAVVLSVPVAKADERLKAVWAAGFDDAFALR